MTRAMWDSCGRPAAPPEGRPVAAGYLYGGHAGCPWPAEWWAKVRGWPGTEWLLPIGVVRPSDNPEAATDHWCAQQFALGAPLGSALCLDIEHGDCSAALSAGWPARFEARARMRGYVPCSYNSRTDSARIRQAAPGLRQWVADWGPAAGRGHEHPLPEAFAVQWDGGVGASFDRSTVFDDAFPLWVNRPGSHPQPPPPAQGGLVMPFVKLLGTRSGDGYWIIGADGGVETFGDAAFYGSMGGRHLNAPVVSAAEHPSGKGYWLVAADGGVFAFGEAKAHGSLGHTHLARPIVDCAAHPSGDGYWLLGADGGVFSFGAAEYHGRAPVH